MLAQKIQTPDIYLDESPFIFLKIVFIDWSHIKFLILSKLFYSTCMVSKTHQPSKDMSGLGYIHKQVGKVMICKLQNDSHTCGMKQVSGKAQFFIGQQ